MGGPEVSLEPTNQIYFMLPLYLKIREKDSRVVCNFSKNRQTEQQTWGQIHLYLKVFKYFLKVFVFDI